MKINDNDKISPLQYTLLIAATLIGAGILSMPRGVVEEAGSDGWLAAIGGGLMSIFITYFIHKLALMFPQDTFVVFSQKILGRWLGLLLSMIYVVYYFLFSALEVRILGDVSNVYLLNRTPFEFLMFAYLWVTIIATRNGIEGIGRLCMLFFPITLILSLLIGLFMYPKLDFTHLLPILHTPWQNVTHAIFLTSLSYLGFEIVLFLVPSLKKPQEALKNAVIGICIITGLYTFFVIINTALFGIDEIKSITWPTISYIKMIEFPGQILERFESILLAIWATTAFTTSIVFTYLAAYITAQITGFREFKPILYFMMPFIYLVAFIPAHVDHTAAMGDFIGKYGLIFISATTILLLLVAKIRKKGMHQ